MQIFFSIAGLPFTVHIMQVSNCYVLFPSAPSPICVEPKEGDQPSVENLPTSTPGSLLPHVDVHSVMQQNTDEQGGETEQR